MKPKFSILLLALFLFIETVPGQNNNDSSYIKGHLKNSSNKKLFFNFENFKDSVEVNKDGYFYYSISKIKKPTMIWVKFPQGYNYDFYCAPGYKISIDANTINRDSFFNSLQLSGVGSITNKYHKYFNELVKKWSIKPLTNQWYDIKYDSFAFKGINKLGLDSIGKFITDSIFNTKNKEPYHEYFKKILTADCDNLFKLYLILGYAGWHDLTKAQTDAIIEKCIDKEFMNNFIDDDYLPLYHYRILISYFYVNYLYAKAIIRQPDKQVNPLKLNLEIIDSLYPPESKSFALNTKLNHSVDGIFTLAELESIYPFILKIKNEALENALVKLYYERKEMLKNFDVGKPAPNFKLPDMKGKMFSLTDFKGKVIFLDLWASWCGPCREDLPLIKQIAEKYRNSNQIQFISIAVKDTSGREKRKNIIKQHEISWLQLEDKNDQAYNKYKISYVPRYILIDKKGNILNFDGPRPDGKGKLMQLINEAISKKE